MNYSVIVPTLWKSDLEKFYETLQILCGDERVIEVVLIDNDIKFEHPFKSKIILLKKLKYYPQMDNIFVNPAWNLGVKKSHGDYLIIMNDDFFVTPNIISLLDSHNNHENIENSIFGISTSCYIEEPTSSDILVTDNEGIGTGWGCFFILRKDKWSDIPNELKIWFGDDFITKHILKNNGKVYTFKNIKASSFSQITSLQMFNDVTENDKQIFFEKYNN